MVVPQMQSWAPTREGTGQACLPPHLPSTISWSALPDLAAEARARSLEFEERRKLAPDFADKLKRAGVFKLLVPADARGLAGSLPNGWKSSWRWLRPTPRPDGYPLMATFVPGLIYASAEPRLRDEFFADPGAYAAWSNLPRVKVKEQDDGIRITGSWGFESGCTTATFVGGMVTLSPLAEGGPPRMVAALAHVSEAKIEETWDPVGLAGTGSHDVHFDDVFVPWHRTFPWPSGIPVSAYPAAIFVPGTWFVAICAAATHLGLARRALDEARNELRGKTDRYTQKTAARASSHTTQPGGGRRSLVCLSRGHARGASGDVGKRVAR